MWWRMVWRRRCGGEWFGGDGVGVVENGVVEMVEKEKRVLFQQN